MGQNASRTCLALIFLSSFQRFTCYDCSYEGYKSNSDGCTTPGNVHMPFMKSLLPACVKHDMCYHCQLSNGWSRSSCDNAFLSDMVAVCRRKFVERKTKRIRRAKAFELRDSKLSALWYDHNGQWIGKAMNTFQYTACVASAGIYYAAVRVGGWAYLLDNGHSHCSESCVLRFGHPSSGLSV